MNARGTCRLRITAKSLIFPPLRQVLARPSVTGRQTVAAWGDWRPRVAAKPGEVLKAKSPPPARHSVESSRQLRPVSGGEGPKAAGRLRRAGQDRKGHGTPRARRFLGSSGVVLCPFTTGLTRELTGCPSGLRVTLHRTAKPERRAVNLQKNLRERLQPTGSQSRRMTRKSSVYGLPPQPEEPR